MVHFLNPEYRVVLFCRGTKFSKVSKYGHEEDPEQPDEKLTQFLDLCLRLNNITKL